jgi:hypothetical protein
MGNTFDYPFVHGISIMSANDYSFTSTSEQALINNKINHNVFDIIDVIYGVQIKFNPNTIRLLEQYYEKGGRLFVNGANIFKTIDFNFNCLAVKRKSNINNKQITKINGNDGLTFDIYRTPNPNSYSVPSPISLSATSPDSQILLKYENGEISSILNQKAITMGFPFESIRDQQQRNKLMKYLLVNLTKN